MTLTPPLPPVAPGMPFTGWYIPGACPDCGGQLVHVAGVPGTRTEVTAVARCGDCGQGWGWTVFTFHVPEAETDTP